MSFFSQSRKIRHDKLKDIIAESPFMTDSELAVFLNVSVATVRLDRMTLGIPEVRERVLLVAEKHVSDSDGISEIIDIPVRQLSLGQRMRGDLVAAMLHSPSVLFLDEPTKGLDAEFKEAFAEILQGLLCRGMTIFMVSHDIEFCARYAHKCGLFFRYKLLKV